MQWFQWTCVVFLFYHLLLIMLASFAQTISYQATIVLTITSLQLSSLSLSHNFVAFTFPLFIIMSINRSVGASIGVRFALSAKATVGPLFPLPPSLASRDHLRLARGRRPPFAAPLHLVYCADADLTGRGLIRHSDLSRVLSLLWLRAVRLVPWDRRAAECKAAALVDWDF